MKLFLLCVVAALSFLPCIAQQADETSVLATSEDGGMLLRTTELFDRSRKYDVGWNWGSFAKASSNAIVHTSLIDEKFYPTNPAANIDVLQQAPDKSRFIVVDAERKLLFGYGCGFATRCDAEIEVTAQGKPVIESGASNTGAVHGFQTAFGERIEYYRRLRSTDNLPAVVLAGNTNRTILGAYRTTEVFVDGSVDPTRSNDMQFIDVKLRSVGNVIVDSTHNGSDPVIRIKVERHKLVKVDKSTASYSIPLHFSFIPTLTKPANEALPSVGLSELPKFLGTTDFDAQLTSKAASPLNSAVSTTSLPARENVWPWYTDCRSFPTAANEIVITREMLQATEGAWTVFDGLVVFWPRTEDGLMPKDNTGKLNDNYDTTGYGYIKGNPSLRAFNEDPTEAAVLEKRITDMNITVTYESSAGIDVDIDYVSFSTPLARALLRDQFRAPIATLVQNTIQAFSTASESATEKTRGHRIVGLRGPEELAEMIWYADRYLNILTGGLIVSEQPVIPADRYRHITWPEDKLVNLISAGTPVNRLIWNEGLTGRVSNSTPASFLRGGSSGYPFDSWKQTWNLKFGFACARFWGADIHVRPGLADIVWRFREPCWEFGDQVEIRTKSCAYEMGFDDDNVTLNENGTVTVNSTRSFLAEVRDHSDWWNLNPVQYFYHLNANGERVYESSQSTRQDMPTLLMHERVLYDNTMPSFNQSYLFDGTAWLNQVWTYSQWNIDTRDGGQPSPTTGRVLRSFGAEGRPWTGEEIRRSLISGTLYGASGNVLYCAGTYFDEKVAGENYAYVGFVNATMNSALTADEAQQRVMYLGDAFGADFAEPFSGLSFQNDDGVLRQTWAKVPNLIRVNNQPTDVYILDDLLYNGATWSGHDATTASRFYIGLRSARMELLRFTDLIGRTVPSMPPLPGADTPPTWRDLLPQLRLVAFWNRGYMTRSASKPDAVTTLTDVVGVGRLRTRHPMRGKVNGRADYEATDSIFVDVTYLNREGKNSNEEYWLGVVNRRTSPMIPSALGAPRPAICPECDRTFISSEEHFDEQAKQTPAWGMYEQDGSRMIAVPMTFQSSNGIPKLLRITEMGNSTSIEQTDYSNKIRRVDTIVDASGVLELPYLPGEGKLFLVRPVEASAVATTGFLAFNSQTKIIVTPMSDAVGTLLPNDDHVRYHMVTMRQTNEAGQPWRVYYRRSLPVDKGAVTDVGGLQWETGEIELGAQFRTFQAPLNPNEPAMINNADGSLGPLFRYGQNGIAQHGNIFKLHAAFPTITSCTYTEGLLTRQRLVVAWGQSVASEDTQINDLLLVETMIEDNAIPTASDPAAQVLVASRQAPWTIDDLAAWVTPSNGACYKTVVPQLVLPPTIVTAFSTPVQNGVAQPIRAIAKPATAAFAALTEFVPIPLSLGGTMAKYPTVTPQSPSSTVYDWPTSSVAWQEQAAANGIAEGWHIMYTLLQRVPNQQQVLAARLFLPLFQTQYYDNGYVNLVAPALFQNATVARLSDNFAGDGRELNLLPTSIQSSGPAAAEIHYFNDPPTTDETKRDFLFEEVAWQERLPWETKFRVRRKFFLHERPPASANGTQRIRYWWTGTTYSQNASVITPSVTSGGLVVAPQQFTLSASSNPLPAYYDPTYNRMTVTGNVSDTSVVEAHLIVPAFMLIDTDEATFAWRTLGESAINQVNMHHVPVPRHAGAFIPADATLQDESGSWAQLSKVSALLSPTTKHLRRLQQAPMLTQDAPPIRASAESFLRTTSDNIIIKRPFVGFSSDSGEVSMSFRTSNGTILSWMKRVRPNTLSEGLHPLFDAMYTPVRELVTEPFTVDDIEQIEFDVEGFLREGVAVFLDKIDVADSSVIDSVAIEIPEAPATHLHISRATSQLLLAGGTSSALYRLRSAYFEPSVVLNDIVIEPLSTLQKNITRAPQQIVDLLSMVRFVSTEQTTLLTTPNPATSTLTVCIVPPLSHSSLPRTAWHYEVDMMSLVGEVVTHLDLGGERVGTIHVDAIPTGTYVLRVRSGNKHVSSAIVCVGR